MAIRVASAGEHRAGGTKRPILGPRAVWKQDVRVNPYRRQNRYAWRKMFEPSPLVAYIHGGTSPWACPQPILRRATPYWHGAPRWLGGNAARPDAALAWCCATVESRTFRSSRSIRSPATAFPADAVGDALLPREQRPTPRSADPSTRCSDWPTACPPMPGAPRRPAAVRSATDAWTAHFARALQAQHARVREFLQAQRDRWRQIAAHFTRQIETLQAEVHALQATNEGLRAELLARPAEGDRTEAAEDASRRYLMAMDDIRELKARNAELQRQLLEAQSAPARTGRARRRLRTAAAIGRRRNAACWRNWSPTTSTTPNRRTGG